MQAKIIYNSNERIEFTRDRIDQLERDILTRRHVERYMNLRQFAHGTVLDCACGTGYGTYIVSKSQDVNFIYGFDTNEAAIASAQTNFQNEKATFQASDIQNINQPANFLISLETIEHLKDPTSLAQLCDRCGISEVVLSFPIKKSTHYNKFHRWDYVPQDIRDIFPKFVILEDSIFASDTCIMRLVRHEKVIIPPRRWKL